MAMMISWVAPVHPSHPYLENDSAPSFAPTICAFHLGFSLARIHRWTGMDGERTLEGGEEVTDADGPGSNSGRWGIGDGLQALLGTPMAAYSGCGERDGGIGHGKMRSRTGLARVGGDVGGTGGRAPSGWEWNGSQPGQGATELGFPRPALWQMQGEAACRAGEPSGQGEDPSSEGLGGHDLLTQTDAGCPASQVMRHHLASQAPLAAKRPDGMWFSPTPYLRSRMAFSTSAWRR